MQLRKFYISANQILKSRKLHSLNFRQEAEVDSIGNPRNCTHSYLPMSTDGDFKRDVLDNRSRE